VFAANRRDGQVAHDAFPRAAGQCARRREGERRVAEANTAGAARAGGGSETSRLIVRHKDIGGRSGSSQREHELPLQSAFPRLGVVADGAQPYMETERYPICYCNQDTPDSFVTPGEYRLVPPGGGVSDVGEGRLHTKAARLHAGSGGAVTARRAGHASLPRR
jgi:hypothetical protein